MKIHPADPTPLPLSGWSAPPGNPPPPLLPYALDSLLPLPPSYRHRPSGPLCLHFPVSHKFHFYSHTIAYTGVPSLTATPTTPFPYVLHHPDQCRPGTLGPFSISLPLALVDPTTPFYLRHITPPTLAYWCFSTWGTQPPHPIHKSPPLMHQPINLHLPTPCPILTIITVPACRPLSPWRSIAIVFAFPATPFRPAFHSVPVFLTLCPPPPPPCVSLTPFQLSTLSPFPPRPLLLPIPHFPHHSLPRWLLLQLIPTCFPINLFRELYYYSLLPITTPLLAPVIPPPSSPH